MLSDIFMDPVMDYLRLSSKTSFNFQIESRGGMHHSLCTIYTDSAFLLATRESLMNKSGIISFANPHIKQVNFY